MVGNQSFIESLLYKIPLFAKIGVSPVLKNREGVELTL